MYEKKSKELISFVNTIAIGLWSTFEEEYQDLLKNISGNKHFKWDFFIKIALIWCSVNEMKETLSEEECEKCYLIIEDSLIKWNTQSLSAIKDLNYFFVSYKNKIKSPDTLKKSIEISEVILGTWIVWNLTDKRDVQDEGLIANNIGKTVYNLIIGYWK